MRTLYTLYIKGQPVQVWGDSRVQAFEYYRRKHRVDALIAAECRSDINWDMRMAPNKYARPSGELFGTIREYEPDDPLPVFTTSERIVIVVCVLFLLFFALPDFLAWCNGQPPVPVTLGH